MRKVKENEVDWNIDHQNSENEKPQNELKTGEGGTWEEKKENETNRPQTKVGFKFRRK